MSDYWEVAWAAVGALAAAALGLVIHRQFARLTRCYDAALEQAGFWTGAWTCDVRHLLRVCDEREAQLSTLNERIEQLQQALQRANRRARTRKPAAHRNGAVPKPGRDRLRDENAPGDS